MTGRTLNKNPAFYSPESQKEKRRAEKVLEKEIRIENFQNLARDIKLQIQKGEQTNPKQDKLKEFTQGCIIIKFQKTSEKEKS